MKFLKNEELLKKIFIIFLIVQPLLDIYVLFTDSVVNFFKFSPSTIIRIISIGILALMVLSSIKFSKKYLWFVVYGILLVIYLILHHINSSSFNANITGTYNYSMISELFYIIRMLLPFAITFITYHAKLNKDQIYKIFICFLMLISSVIVITNITCLSIQSYSESVDLIQSNIFGWFFNYNYTNVDLSSKGIFTSANQIGSLLSLLFPITIYYFLMRKDNRKLTTITLILQLLSVLMIGTRISSYSWIFVYVVMIVIYLYYTLLRKQILLNKKIVINYVVIFFLFLVILNFAPINIRKYASDYKDAFILMEDDSKEENEIIFKKLEEENHNSELSVKLKDDIIKFISDNYQNYSINKEYIINIYDYKQDPVFWYDVMQLPYDKRSDSRQIEQLVTSRIYENNNNKLDKWLGMSFSRFRNGNLYLEKDFKVHFYTLGLFGSLLLVYPYIIVLVIAAIYLIFKRKKQNFEFLTHCFCISLMAIFGFLSGSVLDQLIITLISGFILGLIIKNMTGDEVND